MKASEFKKILKPLVIQAVKEVLLQEGVLSNIVAEVAKGLDNPVTEQKQYREDLRLKEKKLEMARQERIKKLNESNKFGDVFSGTKEIVENKSQEALGFVAPNDKGIDISDIEKLANGKWKTLMG